MWLRLGEHLYNLDHFEYIILSDTIVRGYTAYARYEIANFDTPEQASLFYHWLVQTLEKQKRVADWGKEYMKVLFGNLEEGGEKDE